MIAADLLEVAEDPAVQLIRLHAGLTAGWLVTFAWRAPAAPVRTGLGVWAVTVGGGMLLRAASGQGTALPFIIVAAVTLFVALVGWRVIAFAVRRARRR